MSTADCTARYGWSSISKGAPNTAMRQSPMNLSSVPSCRNTMSAMRLK